MSEATRRRRRIHVGLALAELICSTAFVVELLRAMGGNTLSWAYVVTWPLFAGYAVYVWRQLLRQESGVLPHRRSGPERPGDDEALDAWNEYLRQVHRDDRTDETEGPR